MVRIYTNCFLDKSSYWNYFDKTIKLTGSTDYVIVILGVLLALKRLGCQFDAPVVFPKLCFLERGWSSDFLWLLILSQITFFLKISLKFIKYFRRHEDFFFNFWYFYQYFANFDSCKETNGVALLAQPYLS